MLSIENEDVMKFITNKLSSKELGWNRKGVWLGLSKTGKHWRWTNGEQIFMYHVLTICGEFRLLNYLGVDAS